MDGINAEVQAEIDIVKKQGIRALYYFCDENSSEKTVLEQSIAGSNCAKSKTVHSFSDLGKDGADDFINDIIAIYHYYCKGKVISKHDDENEEFQYLDISDAEKNQDPTVPKTILNNIDKCKAYFVEFTTGHPYTRFPNEVEKSNEIDEWCVQFLPILFEGKSVKHFNVGMFLEVLKEQQQDAFYQVVQIRWQAIQSYFLGNVSKCIQHLEEALKCAKETKQPVWVIKDILIDLRNQYLVLHTINNKFSDSDAQKELINSNEEVYYPTLDRVNDSLHEKFIENLFKNRIKLPYSVTFGNDLGQYCGLLASTYVISMYNGSLTHIILIYKKIRNFLFFLCNQYNDWGLRRDMLKVAIYDGTENEINGIQNAFPEILNNLTSTGALSIMQFCENQPVEYKRIISQLRAFGTVGYYLDDNNFKVYEATILTEIDKWLNRPNSILAIGQSIFWGLSRVSYRMSQDTLAQICCTFIDKRYTRWYVDMFKFIANRMNLRKMSDASAAQLVTHIVSVLENDDQRVQIQYYPHILWVLRVQNRALTEDLDKKSLNFCLNIIIMSIG